MSITFEGVSYSYTPPSKKKKKMKGQTNAASDDAQGQVQDKPDWGSDPNADWAIRDINFTIQDGEFFGIAGHTGSGKSTLIQHMNGLLHPSSGRVLVDGEDLAQKKVAIMARAKVGLVFQYPEHQLFAASVYDDIAFGPHNMGLSADEVDMRVREALSRVSLDFDTIAQKSPFELSGGQQRRVAFAGVLAMKPSTLILDEPVAGLDPAARIEFLNFIADLHKQGLTVVMVSHSMNDLARFCDRVLVLKEGQRYLMGSPDEVFTRSTELNDIGLSAPSAQRLVDNLRKNGILLDEGLYDAERLADSLAALYKKNTV